MRGHHLLACLALIGLVIPAASAEPYNADLVCRPDTLALSDHETLRAISLDLRGVTPTLLEYEAIDATGGVPENLIDEWLDSEAFVDRVVRFHRSLFWNNLSNIALFSARTKLYLGQGDVFYRSALSLFLRGDISDKTGYNNIDCLDEPAEFTNDGSIVQKLQPDGTMREGWVYVTPHWDPTTPIKVCALDAQEAEYGHTGAACNTPAAYEDAGCGCGPNLNRCNTKDADGEPKLRDAIAKDLNLRVRYIIEQDRPWTELLTDTPLFVNGPMTHFLKYQAGLDAGLSFTPHPVPQSMLPDIPYTETDTWVEISLDSGHSGVLTSPAFLLRFQTNRARANKYYMDFLCAPLIAPAGGLPASSDEEAMEPDLQKRPGCNYCHARLEPTAAYWGRWVQRGTGFLNHLSFPSFSAACEQCALNTGTCEGCEQYTTQSFSPSEAEYFGYLQSFTFLKEQHISHPNDGPKVLVYRSMVDNRLPTCITRKVATLLFGRSALPMEESWLVDVAHEFVTQGYSFRSLVKTLILSDMYRSVR
jgi:hypothetical protein